MLLAAALLGVLLLVAAMVVWQHAQRGDHELTYGVEDAVRYVSRRLPMELHEDAVRRILEYQLFYLQGLAQKNRHHPVESVAGPYGPAVDYVAEQIKVRHDREYPVAVIESVLALGADYLASIGAVGERVAEDDL